MHQLNSSPFQSLSQSWHLLWAPSKSLVFGFFLGFFIFLLSILSCFPQCQLFSKFNLLKLFNGMCSLPIDSLEIKKIYQPEIRHESPRHSDFFSWVSSSHHKSICLGLWNKPKPSHNNRQWHERTFYYYFIFVFTNPVVLLGCFRYQL